MNSKDNLLYIVEGQNEETLIKCIKNRFIYPGKTRVFNVWTKNIGNISRVIRNNTICILIFDIDEYKKARNTGELLLKNIKYLEKHCKDILIVCQNDTLEDELVKSCSIRKITEFLNTKSLDEHKNKFNQISNLIQKLEEKQFDISKIWIGKNIEIVKHNNRSKEFKFFKNI